MRLTQYSIKAEFEKLLLLGNNTLTRLNADAMRAQAELGPLRESYLEHRSELADFRKRHNLARPARDPSSWTITIGLIILMIALEAVVNGAFFAKGAQLGLLGGVVIAIGVSISNVIIAFLVGYFPARWTIHRNWLLKLVGFLLLFSAVAMLVGIQIFAAHFRDATATYGEDAALSHAFENLRVTPLRLSDINSYYLVGMGMIFSIFSFLKGLYMDDPYPGYGGVYRRFEVSRADYSDVHDNLFDLLKDYKEEAVAELRHGIAAIPSFPQTAAAISVQRSTLVEQFRAYQNSVEVAVNQLLERYRDINRQYRKTPVPAYFAHRWRLPVDTVESAEAGQLLRVVPDADTDVDVPLLELKQLSMKLFERYDALQSAYPHPTGMS